MEDFQAWPWVEQMSRAGTADPSGAVQVVRLLRLVPCTVATPHSPTCVSGFGWEDYLMATRKTLIRSRAGVRLQRIEHLARQQVVQSSWRLSTLRQNQPRSFADETEAEDAFDMEVIASLTDPIIIDMQRRGLID